MSRRVFEIEIGVRRRKTLKFRHQPTCEEFSA